MVGPVGDESEASEHKRRLMQPRAGVAKADLSAFSRRRQWKLESAADIMLATHGIETAGVMSMIHQASIQGLKRRSRSV